MKLLVSSLEASANLHLKSILNHLNDVELFGIFDPNFGKPYLPSSAFSVMGFLDALPKILKAKKSIEELAKISDGVDKVLLIDGPAFNIPLAKAIKKRNPNLEIIYYILPQVWAWKEKRVAKVEKYCDTLISLFPFELKWFKDAKFLGHPLLDKIKEDEFNSSSTNSPIAFLPGSRVKEIKRLMPIFKDLSNEIKGEKLLVIPPFIKKDEILNIYGNIDGFTPIFDTKEALLKSKFAFICSGTATLEAALIGTPFVLAYKANKFDFFIAKKFVKLPYAGLANIIFHFLNKPPLHEELLQDEVTKKRLLSAFKEVKKERFQEYSKELREYLVGGNANNIAKMIKV